MYIISKVFRKEKINDSKYPSLDDARKAAIKAIKEGEGSGLFNSVNIYAVNGSKPLGDVVEYAHRFIWRSTKTMEYIDEYGYINVFSEIRYIKSDGSLGEYSVSPPTKTYKPSDFKYYVKTYWPGGHSEEHRCKTLNEAKKIARSRTNDEWDISVYKVLKWRKVYDSPGSRRIMLHPDVDVKIGEMRYNRRNRKVEWVGKAEGELVPFRL